MTLSREGDSAIAEVTGIVNAAKLQKFQWAV